jgi:V/A-type H+-transporting ATPase subunit C
VFIKYPEFSSSDTRYAYAVGRVRALETRLLDRSRFERMLGADSADDALRMLQDTDYGAHLGEASSAADYEKVLESERLVAYNLFKDLCLDRPAVSIHFSKFDFHNIRVLVKAKFAGKEYDSLLSEHGEFEIQALKEEFEAETFEHLPEHLAGAAKEGVELLKSPEASRVMDIAVDKAEHQYKLRVAEGLSNDFLSNLLRLESDVQNILTLYRVKWLGGDYKAYETTLLEGGFLEKERLKEALS